MSPTLLHDESNSTASGVMHSTPAFFQQQTVFLTGGTGGLGGCLLFKLALKVNTLKIYVLVRGSAAKAKARWAETMPAQLDPIVATKKVHFIIGDITMKDCGIDPSVLTEMADQVTLIIHSAGSISLTDPLKKSITDNCIPALELAQLASTFKNLSRFVHISTAYANSFLPDGVIEEKVYELGDAETQLADILDTGFSQNSVPDFPWPYSFAKHLTERLLLSRNPQLPLLIVRPTNIGPAISQPYPYYGPPGSCPVSTYIRTYMEDPDSGVVHVSPGNVSGSNIVDEIPVDLVANLILLHVMHATTGIVHASSQSYVPRRLSQFHDNIRAHIPRRLPAVPFRYVSDKRIEQGRYAQFWVVMGRDWHFSNAVSKFLPDLTGPLSMSLEGHDAENFMDTRAKLIALDITSHIRSRL
ncbi:male sterility protein-domain-containing protein [Mycena latifolia]|nr:male sterility protein-domain-containing protein [Mycena latifolia]